MDRQIAMSLGVHLQTRPQAVLWEQSAIQPEWTCLASHQPAQSKETAQEPVPNEILAPGGRISEGTLQTPRTAAAGRRRGTSGYSSFQPKPVWEIHLARFTG